MKWVLLALDITFIICLAFATKISLKTKLEIRNNTYLVTFESYSGSQPFGNSVEFLWNNNTVDEIRGYDKECYHKFGECNPKHCNCSEDSKTYVLTFEMSISTKNNSFGCRMRYLDESRHQLVMKEIRSSIEDLEFLGNGFYTGVKELDITQITEKTKENIETASRNPDKNQKKLHKHDFWFIASRLITGFGILIFFVVLTCCSSRIRDLYNFICRRRY